MRLAYLPMGAKWRIAVIADMKHIIQSGDRGGFFSLGSFLMV
jgi:hypothetical protein